MPVIRGLGSLGGVVSDNVPDVPDLPDRSKAEIGAAIVRAGISSIPVAGGAAAELFDLVLGPSLERRNEDWFNYLADVVDELRERLEGFNPRDSTATSSSSLLFSQRRQWR